jgi:membrane-bound ClpP family serine protease
MKIVALVLSLFVAALGALGLLSPMRLLHIVRHFQSPVGLYAAGALRVILGGALFFAAPASRAPKVLRILGIIILVAGLFTPLIGVERVHRLVDWWSTQGAVFMRVWAAFALAFGLLLACAVAPGLRRKEWLFPGGPRRQQVGPTR